MELLEQLRALDHGLGEPGSAEAARASAEALAALALEPRHAEELLELAFTLEERLSFEDAPAPDFVLALAQCWHALPALPCARALDSTERTAHLTATLAALDGLSPSPERDGFGASLTRSLHEEQRASGREEQALSVLTEALARFGSTPAARVELAGLLSDAARRAERWGLAWQALERLEGALPELAGEAQRASTRLASSLRCQLELAAGLVERASFSLTAERVAVAAGPGQPDERLGLLLDVASLALAGAEPRTLEKAARELESALAEAELVRARPRECAALAARHALLRGLVEELGGPPATELLEHAAQRADLDPAHRASVLLFLFNRGLGRDDRGLRERALAGLDRLGGEPELGPELAAARSAAATLHATLAGVAPELDRRAAELEAVGARRLAALAARPERAGGFGYFAYQHRRLVSEARLRLALIRGNPRTALESCLPEQALGTLARLLGAPPGSVPELAAALLAPRRVLLTYVAGADFVHAFLLEGEQVLHAAVPWEYGLEQAPRELADLLASSPAPLAATERARRLARLEALAGELGARLLPEAFRARLATAEELYVCGTELLGAFPFEVLPLAGTPLGLRLPVAELPSLPVGLALARAAAADVAARPFELLLVAAPRQAATLDGRPSRLPPLEPAAASLEPLQARGQRLLGPSATPEALLAGLASPRTSFLHVLAHGHFDHRRELPAALVLAPDARHPEGLLWNEELVARDFMAPPMVALTACSSALGPRRAGDDGAARLGGTFLARGARCTLLASSDLALEPTVKLMEIFTYELAAGATPARAQLAARRALAREPAYDHPFYLLALHLVGLGHAPLHRRP